MSAWTNHLDSMLTYLWDQGMSASNIGIRLGRSRNSVIGRARRIRLAARPNPVHQAKIKNIKIWQPRYCKNPACKKEILGHGNKSYCHQGCANEFYEMKKLKNIVVVEEKPKIDIWKNYCPCGCLAVPGATRCYAWPLNPRQEAVMVLP